MTYEESAALMRDTNFQGRIKVAALRFATYIQSEAITTPGHSSRLRWAQQTALQPDQAAIGIQPMVTMDPQVQADGATIGDPQLQTAVEGVVNKFI